ncbi:MAG: chloride channel protein [Melioribacteraceae bacterium]|nr:chloride channel protein [Melioribacteraceae bacterium]MCF8353636.1 chloride channel protein [Melioribacteraceae bacterium]MCF8393406.1 chloride channel protein [Melioribacteraceae bacterium]MCF8419263.1 chloride channel protein [Melioribacteraceae bacterium]
MKQLSFSGVYSSLSQKTVNLIERAKLTEHTFMIIVALVIGTLAGFAAIGIRWLIEEISLLSFPGGGTLLDNILSAPWYIILLAPIIGGMIVGPLIYFFAPEAKGHGVPEVMQAILLKGGKIRPRVAIIKAFASAITIGTGGSVGREGPIIQIGASLGSTVGQFFKIPSKRMKTLVGCGAAAGIAAAFNAPIAGALFALEIILMDFAVAQFSPIVIASVMATVVSHSFEGNFAAFIVPHYTLVTPYELIFYFVLGAIAGLVSFLFIKVLYFSEDYFDNRFKFPEYLKPVVGGLGIGLTALIFPQIMGVGYDSINMALHSNVLWYSAFALIFLKIFATSLTLGSGGSGGIFAPSLFMGAMLGVFFGHFVNVLFPDISADPGAYALVAMGGLVAGTTRAPITAIIIVFELTNDYRIILPLMITCIISTILSSKLSRESIYTLKLLLRNIKIKEGTETNIMESIFVKDVAADRFEIINAADNFNLVVNKVVRGQGRTFPVIGADKTLTGMISVNSIKDFLFEKDSLQHLLIANDISTDEFEKVTPDDNCQLAIDRMRKYDFEELPVVDSYDSNKLIGMVRLKDIQDAYQREIERRDIASNLASSISMKDEETNVHFMEGYSIAEVKPPDSFIGKSIKDLAIRSEWGIDVLSIKTHEGRTEKIKAFPGPDYIINEKDTLVIAGEIKNINMIRNLE